MGGKEAKLELGVWRLLEMGLYLSSIINKLGTGTDH